MTTLIPSINTCLGRMTRGEKRLARTFESHLEDDYLCWYDVPVGLQKIDTGLWEIRYSFHLLGYLDERDMAIHARPRTESDGKT